MTMQWEIDERTIRDCPGGRTEVEWREAARKLEKEVQGTSRCHTCGQSLREVEKYRVTETEEWLPAKCDLPRGR
jgi:ribosomal protein L34E